MADDDAEYLRQRAQRMRILALLVSDAQARRGLEELAREFDARADAIEAEAEAEHKSRSDHNGPGNGPGTG